MQQGVSWRGCGTFSGDRWGASFADGAESAQSKEPIQDMTADRHRMVLAACSILRVARVLCRIWQVWEISAMYALDCWSRRSEIG